VIVGAGLVVAASCATVLLAASCASSHQSVAPSAKYTPVTVTAGAQRNGRQVTLHVGDRLVLTLPSTYWAGAQSSAPGVLRAVESNLTPSKPCIPGGGCGTSTTDLVASAPGTATVTATRTSCGEAMRCTGANGSFGLDVRVTADPAG
jgi:hypothetical protein